MPVAVGIDLAAGRGITEVATLTVEDGSRRPVFDASNHRRVVSDADIITAIAAAQPSVVAIDAPLTLPRAVMLALAANRHDAAFVPRNQAGSQQIVEATTPTLGSSPYTRAAERDPIWSALGVRPLPVSFLGGLTFRAISLLPGLRTAVPEAAIIEVFPSATLRCLGITQMSPDRKATKFSKTSEASRRIVHAGLKAHISGMEDGSRELYGADLLDALAAALTGVAFLRGAYRIIGDAEEGTIILPE